MSSYIFADPGPWARDGLGWQRYGVIPPVTLIP